MGGTVSCETPTLDRLIRLSEVMELTGMSRGSIYRFMKTCGFPQQYKPGGASSRWSLAEALAWRETQRPLK